MENRSLGSTAWQRWLRPRSVYTKIRDEPQPMMPLILVLCLVQLSAGADPTSQPEDLNLARQWRNNAEVKRCALCHYSPGNDYTQRDTDFCQLNEARQWLETDRHASARVRIEPSSGPNESLPASNQLSQRILKKLGYDPATEAGYVRYREACLTCHAGFDRSRQQPRLEADDQNLPGIGCTVCHQLDGNEQWIDLHGTTSASRTWRLLSPEIKAAKGMRPLTTAVEQARLCYRCHLGDMEAGMFVTHSMMAAGHPPLASVELATLCQSMPIHWREPHQLAASMAGNPQARDAYVAASYKLRPQQSVEEWPHRTQTVFDAALVAQSQIVEMFQQAANTGQHWGDYALFDCAGCHHGLKAQSWRQRHWQGAAPGKPIDPRWTAVLLNVSLKIAEHEQPVLDARRQFQQALTKVPFGDRADTAETATVYQSQLQLALQQLGQIDFNADRASQAMIMLSRTEASALVDYQSARQLVWATRQLEAELARLNRPLSESQRSRLHALTLNPRTGSQQLFLELPSAPTAELHPVFQRAHQRREAEFDAEQFYLLLKSTEP